jgi:hypothetical protein
MRTLRIAAIMPSTMDSQQKSLTEKLGQHWLGSAIGLAVSVAGATAIAANYLYIAPRDFQVTQLKDENGKLQQRLQEATAARGGSSAQPESSVALPETGVFEKASVTTVDGRCNIQVANVAGNSVRLVTTVDALKPVSQDYIEVGQRLAVDANDKMYYIDLHRVRGNIVDLAVYQHKR